MFANAQSVVDACRALNRRPLAAALADARTLAARAAETRRARAIALGKADPGDHPREREIAARHGHDPAALAALLRAQLREQRALLAFALEREPIRVPPVPTTRPSTRPRERTSRSAVVRDDGSGEAAEPPSSWPTRAAHPHVVDVRLDTGRAR